MFTGEFSGLFAQIYQCPEHGETWHVETATEVDSVNDEVYEHVLCSRCHRSVTPLLHDGVPVMHPLTDEEAYWEMGGDDDDEEEEDW